MYRVNRYQNQTEDLYQNTIPSIGDILLSYEEYLELKKIISRKMKY